MNYNPKPTMTYTDYSEKYPWWWFLQKIIHPINISIYWETKQKVWCREVRKVRGFIKRGWFNPYPGQVVSYKQRFKK